MLTPGEPGQAAPRHRLGSQRSRRAPGRCRTRHSSRARSCSQVSHELGRQQSDPQAAAAVEDRPARGRVAWVICRGRRPSGAGIGRGCPPTQYGSGLSGWIPRTSTGLRVGHQGRRWVQGLKVRNPTPPATGNTTRSARRFGGNRTFVPQGLRSSSRQRIANAVALAIGRNCPGIFQ